MLTGDAQLYVSEAFAEQWLAEMDRLRRATDSDIAAAAATAVDFEADSLVSGERLLGAGSREEISDFQELGYGWGLFDRATTQPDRC